MLLASVPPKAHLEIRIEVQIPPRYLRGDPRKHNEELGKKAVNNEQVTAVGVGN